MVVRLTDVNDNNPRLLTRETEGSGPPSDEPIIWALAVVFFMIDTSHFVVARPIINKFYLT